MPLNCITLRGHWQCNEKHHFTVQAVDSASRYNDVPENMTLTSSSMPALLRG